MPEPVRRIEVFTGAGRRRRWPAEEKAAIVAESYAVRVMMATRPVDFRKGAHSLAALAAEVLSEDPFSGVVLVFRSKRADRIKLVVWDGSGLVKP